MSLSSVFVISVSPYRKMSVQHLKSRHARFLPHPFQLTNFPVTRHYASNKHTHNGSISHSQITSQHTARTYQMAQPLNLWATYPVRLLARSRANLARRRRQQITSKANRGKPRMQETIVITIDSGETATNTGTVGQSLR